MRKILIFVWRIITTPFHFIGWLLIWIITAPFRFIGWLFMRIPAVRNFYEFMTFEPEDRPVIDSLNDAITDYRAMLPHLIALRTQLIRIVLVLAAAVIGAFMFAQNLLNFLAAPIGGLDKLVAVEVTESVGVFMRVSLLAGVAVTSPYLYFELWYFLAPGIRARQRQVSLALLPLAIALFLGGMWFCYTVMLPVALPFLSTFMGITSQWRPDSYFRFVTGLMLWIGIAFEFPILILILTIARRVTPGMLLKHWRIAVVLMSIIAAAITPTVDPINMALVMLPMIGLYFLSILLSFIAISTGRPNKKAEKTP